MKRIYVIKPNSLHPDAMFFLKEKAQVTNHTAELMENQSGPAYDPNMIHRCDELYVAVGEDRSIGKGVYGEVLTAQEESKPVFVFEYDPVAKALKGINGFTLIVEDANNFRKFGRIEGEASVSTEPTPDELLM